MCASVGWGCALALGCPPIKWWHRILGAPLMSPPRARGNVPVGGLVCGGPTPPGGIAPCVCGGSPTVCFALGESPNGSHATPSFAHAQWCQPTLGPCMLWGPCQCANPMLLRAPLSWCWDDALHCWWLQAKEPGMVARRPHHGPWQLEAVAHREGASHVEFQPPNSSSGE